MIFKTILGNIKDYKDLTDYHVERINLSNDELLKKILKVTSDHENEYAIDLSESKILLKDGDILSNDNNHLIVIWATSTDVLIISPKTIHDMGVIAHKIGNRHTPAQFHGDKMYVQYDYLLEKLVKDLQIPHIRTNAKMAESFDYDKIEGGHSHS